MKIKLAILEKDIGYLNRIVNAFAAKYPEKFQLYSFTNVDAALSTLDEEKIEVLVSSDAFEIDVKKLPKRCGFAYFVDSAGIDTVNGMPAICKFQKADLIYKQILSVYSENAGNVSGLKFGDDRSKIIIFESVSGGVGGSTLASACATRFAQKGKKTMYLNLERYGSSDVFFKADGQFDMSDIIFVLKSKKANLSMKLESCAKQADNGVYFYSQSKIALDMAELDTDDIIRLISELQISGSYDYIVVDADFDINKESLRVYRKAHSIVWVGDGSEISNTKLFRAFNALSVLEQNADVSISSRISLIYNKFSNKTGRTLNDIGIKNIGGAPRYEHADTAQVLSQLSSMEMLDKLI